MKSKLFLSLSLLTAVFSVNANTSVTQADYFITDHRPTQSHAVNQLVKNMSRDSRLVLPVLFGGSVAYTAYKHSENQAELPTKSYVQVAKDRMVSGYNIVKAKSSELYNQATYENMKNGMVNGFNTAKTFAMQNKALTAGTVAGTAAVVYGAYKLYNSDMFAKSKKQTTSTPVAPVKQPKRVLVRKAEFHPYKGA